MSDLLHIIGSDSKALCYSKVGGRRSNLNDYVYDYVPPKLQENVFYDAVGYLLAIPQQIRLERNLVEAFRIYADADISLEKIEFIVSHFVNLIETQIEFAVDLARGK